MLSHTPGFPPIIKAVFFLCCSFTVAAQQNGPAQSVGQSLFLKGTPGDGSEIIAVTQGHEMPGSLFACVNCHRHSGLGTSEGGYQVPDITGSKLFDPIELKQKELYGQRTEGFYTRPAYTRETLFKAITQGRSASGRELSTVMPRYKLSQQQTNSLIDYLKSLDYSNPPGVSDDNLQLATIITDGVPEQKRAALLSTLNQFIKEKNAQTRHEVRRVKYSPWHKDWHYDHYRKWQLNIWDLKGPPSGWNQQLQAYNRKNPVFAVIGGTSNLSWYPIGRFCEQQQLPCLFPDTDLPPATPGHYGIYFSAGIGLEARRVLPFLKQNNQYRRVIQVQGTDPRAAVAVADMKQRLNKLQGGLEQQIFTLSEWLKAPPLRSEKAAETLVILWLDSDELTQLSNHPNSSGMTTVLSSTLLNRSTDQIPHSFKKNGWLIHPYSLPGTTGNRLRSKTWLYMRGITTPYDKLQSNTYLGLSVLTEAMMHIRSNFSQNYLIERIEHMLENSPETSVYPRLSLAPGQRFAAKGSYLLPLIKSDLSEEQARLFWAVPEQ